MAHPESYRERDGCWNCRFYVMDLDALDFACCRPRQDEDMYEYGWLATPHPWGICDHWEVDEDREV
jgi:hypothetical protein